MVSCSLLLRGDYNDDSQSHCGFASANLPFKGWVHIEVYLPGSVECVGICGGKSDCIPWAAGEIGQVGKSTYLHGFTAAVGILREVIDVEDQAQQPAQQEKPKPPSETQ